MDRRNFLKSIGAAVVALPLVSLIKTDGRERIYLRRGEVLQGRTFTKDVEVWADEGAMVLDCRFEKAELRVRDKNGGDDVKGVTISHCTFVGDVDRVGMRCDEQGNFGTLFNSRFEKTPEGIRHWS